MKKSLPLLLLTLCCSAPIFGQEFSFRDLTKLRTMPYPAFEAQVQQKGYKQSDVENNGNCAVFKNGRDVISYCLPSSDSVDLHGLAIERHPFIRLETADKSEYDRLKNDITATMNYYDTHSFKQRKDHYVEHIYLSDLLSVHLYNIAYHNDENPCYEIDVYSIYSGY